MIAFENQVSHSTDFQSLSDEQNDVYLFRTVLQSEVVTAKKIDAGTLTQAFRILLGGFNGSL